MLWNIQKIKIISIIVVSLIFANNIMAQISNSPRNKSSIKISLVQQNFVTIVNEEHKGNRIGYRFHEHEPISFGQVPLSNKNASIDINSINNLENTYKKDKDVFIYEHKIEKNQFWSKQDWIYYMVPEHDGIKILMIIKTYNEGLPEYYGIQQCFRMGGKTNAEWRRKIANTPAFSEYDLWNGQSSDSEKKSLTYVLRKNNWQALPAKDKTVGARTPLGTAVDYLRTNGKPLKEVGPYKAEMLEPIDNGLITRTDLTESWVCGIYWENTSHVTNHHPADCLHPIVNVGNIPPFSKKAISGKIYWLKGNKDSLLTHYKKDFLGESNRNKLVIASSQFPVTGNISKNAGWILNQMRIAKIRGADLIHLPECALSGYGGADIHDFKNYDWIELQNQTKSILLLADELNLWVLLGSSHKLSEENKPHNSLYVINPEGKIVDRYDKRFCTGGDLKHYTPGEHFVVFEVNKIKCGLLICYDVRFPELYRGYRKLGVDVIFQSFYNARGKEDGIHPKIMPVTCQARAATNYFYLSLTNSSAPYSWPCYFITPDGLVSNKLQANKPGVLISAIDISKKYYDASKPYRMDAINGKLNSGSNVKDIRSQNRKIY